MCGHLGHLGHLTSKPQQNRPFFNLSKMANHKYLGHLGHLTAAARSAYLCVRSLSRLPIGTSLREAHPLCPEFIPLAFHNI